MKHIEHVRDDIHTILDMNYMFDTERKDVQIVYDFILSDILRWFGYIEWHREEHKIMILFSRN